MEKDQLTFNDLPTVVGELCDRIASMESLLTEKLSKQYETKENTLEQRLRLRRPEESVPKKIWKIILRQAVHGLAQVLPLIFWDSRY